MAVLAGALFYRSPAHAQVVSDEVGLRNAILAANASGGPATITLGANIMLTGSLPPIQATVDVHRRELHHNAATLGRVFTIVEGTVTIANLTIQNARTVGGAGGAGSFPVAAARPWARRSSSGTARR